SRGREATITCAARTRERHLAAAILALAACSRVADGASGDSETQFATARTVRDRRPSTSGPNPPPRARPPEDAHVPSRNALPTCRHHPAIAVLGPPRTPFPRLRGKAARRPKGETPMGEGPPLAL